MTANSVFRSEQEEHNYGSTAPGIVTVRARKFKIRVRRLDSQKGKIHTAIAARSKRFHKCKGEKQQHFVTCAMASASVDDPPYKVCSIDGRGNGLIATRDIEKGQLIFVGCLSDIYCERLIFDLQRVR